MYCAEAGPSAKMVKTGLSTAYAAEVLRPEADAVLIGDRCGDNLLQLQQEQLLQKLNSGCVLSVIYLFLIGVV